MRMSALNSVELVVGVEKDEKSEDSDSAVNSDAVTGFGGEGFGGAGLVGGEKFALGGGDILVGCGVNRRFAWSAGWSVGRLVGRWVGCMVYWLVVGSMSE